MNGTALVEQITERRAGAGDPRALLGEMRRARLLVPLERGGLWTGHFGGVRWVFAFTGEEAFARFVRSGAGEGSGSQDGGRPWEFAELLGARILDEIIPAIGDPAGVAVDVADPDGAMLFPPAMGIVPDGSAVDAPNGLASGTGATQSTGAAGGGIV